MNSSRNISRRVKDKPLCKRRKQRVLHTRTVRRVESLSRNPKKTGREKGGELESFNGKES